MPAAAAAATTSEEILLAIQVNAEKARTETAENSVQMMSSLSDTIAANNALMMQNMAQMFGVSRQESLDREGILRG